MKKKDGKQLLKNISEYRAGKKKGVVLDIPDLGNSNYNFGWVCLEAGRSLMKLNKYNEALAVLDNVGRNTDDFSRVMAAESGGDVLATQHQWLRADNKSKSGKNKVKQKITKNKLAKKVKEILRQKKRISWWPKKGDSTALLKELVSLVKNDGSKAEVKDLNPDKAETEEAENKAESNKTPEKQTLPAEYSYNPFKEAVLEALLRRSKATAKIPYGKKAASKALKHLQVFFEEQYYGVYRGECILAVADYFLEYNIDLKQASRYYYMLDTWLRKVQQFDKKIATFDIPEKIKNISAPPDSNYNNDSWGNIIDSKNYPGNINNRR